MTAPLDPGQNAPAGPAHTGDDAAQRIRAAMERLRPEHRVAKQRTDEEQAAIEAVTG